MLSNKFPFIWESGFRGEDFLEINQSETRMACGGHVCSNYLFLVTAAILVGGRGRRTQFSKRTTQRPFHQSLVQIGPVVLEELIKMQKANDRRTPSGSNS